MSRLPHIDHLDLPCKNLPPAFDGFKLLHLTDLHLSGWTPQLELWREKLSTLRPDMVAITGDLGHRAWTWTRAEDSVLRLLEPLKPPLGTYFILGNHDSLKIAPALAAHHLRFLQNQSTFIERAGQRVALIGLNQHRRIDTDIPRAMRGVAPDDFKIMMLHYPDLIYQAAAVGTDVALAGHTHGGQVCWPDGSPIFRQDTLPPAMCTGVHRINGTWIVVNRGIGKAGIRVRMFCPPQAILVTLHRGEIAADLAGA